MQVNFIQLIITTQLDVLFVLLAKLLKLIPNLTTDLEFNFVLVRLRRHARDDQLMQRNLDATKFTIGKISQLQIQTLHGVTLGGGGS